VARLHTTDSRPRRITMRQAMQPASLTKDGPDA
jgi:hypothetical protein